MGIEEKLPSGVLLTTRREARRLHAQGVAVAGHLRPGLLRDRDDDHRRPALRPGPLRHGGLPRLAAAGRPDDRRRPGEPEDGPGAAPDLRPDARARSGCSRWASARQSGGMFNNYAIVQGVDHVVPVDMYLPGCPPRPEMLIDAILKLHDQIQHSQARRQPRARDRASRRRRRSSALPDHRDEGPAAVSDDDQPTSRRRATPAVVHAPARRPAEVGRRPAAACSAPRHRRHLRLRRPGPRRSQLPGATAAARTAAGSTRWPTRSRRALRPAVDDAVEKVVVDRGEITFHVAPRAPASTSCQTLRDDPALRFELCSRRQRRALPARDGPRAARRLPPALDDPQPADPARGHLPRRRPAHPVGRRRSTRPTTGTSARPSTSSASSSTATRR